MNPWYPPDPALQKPTTTPLSIAVGIVMVAPGASNTVYVEPL
jgi:hypothetical protein